MCFRSGEGDSVPLLRWLPVDQYPVQPQVFCQHPKAEAARRRFHIEGIEEVIPQFNGTAEAYLHISMADFVVYVVVVAPVKPDLIGQPVFRFLFEVAFFQPLPALFLQAQAVPQVVQKLLKYICRAFLFQSYSPP